MGDEIEFASEGYGGMAGSEAIDSQQTSADATFLNLDPCPNSGCTNTNSEAEVAWVKLVSAIPVAGQVQSFVCVAGGTAAPTQDEVQSMVTQIRPKENPDQYALRTMSEQWLLVGYDFGKNPESGVASILRNRLTELSNGWQGSDFDAFAEQMEKVFANCEVLTADIGDDTSGIAGLLEQKASEIYALQGGDSHELPYPAPQYWVEDEGGIFSDPTVHNRVPFRSGECEIATGCAWDGEDDSTKKAMELGGFDGEYADELNQYVTDQTEFHFTRLKSESPDAPEEELRTQAAGLAEQDGNTRAKEDYDSSSQDYEARAHEQNDTVLARWQDAEVSAMEFVPAVEPSGDTSFRDSAGGLDGSTYSPVSGGDFNASPTSSGTTGLNPPASTASFSSGGTGTTGTGANPWESTTGGEDEPGGGLAGGGGLGAATLPGTGAGVGAGGGAGGGSLGGGAGLFGPAIGGGGAVGAGAGGGRGAGSGVGKGAGLFGKTAGAGARGGAGAMMGAGGGGRGAGAGNEDEEGRATWLTEDEDVWGTARFNDDDDPLV
ncbi:hypothetical protein [Glycomyces harbinensis]|uniref:Uncharacterized protein n=1 Tax=Glycomyces harbinensis TaxID=58114 RepID=A0A1G7CIZ8_9ACTN|nr:hypothetical protein [Glycomyces harbinensis]SDE39307.1 hypothetical protein SAMN05216270_12013 [Glycomyces harbinensis]